MTKSSGTGKTPFYIIFCAITLLLAAIIFFKPILRLFYPVEYIDTIKKYSSEYNLEKHLVMAIIFTESKFKEDAVSSKDAMGLMQLKEETAKWCMEQFKISSDGSFTTPETNIRTGCAYLRYLIDKFGSVETALAAYNAGEGNVKKWLENQKYDTELESIPFGETRHYVELVKDREKIYKFLY